MISQLFALQNPSDKESRFEDPIVEEVRSLRKKLSDTFHGDLAAIAFDLVKRQEALGSKLRRWNKR